MEKDCKNIDEKFVEKFIKDMYIILNFRNSRDPGKFRKKKCGIFISDRDWKLYPCIVKHEFIY